MIQQTLASSISKFQVYSESDQPLENVEPVALYRIKHWGLLEIVDMIMLRPITLEELANFYVT